MDYFSSPYSCLQTLYSFDNVDIHYTDKDWDGNVSASSQLSHLFWQFFYELGLQPASATQSSKTMFLFN